MNDGTAVGADLSRPPPIYRPTRTLLCILTILFIVIIGLNRYQPKSPTCHPERSEGSLRRLSRDTHPQHCPTCHPELPFTSHKRRIAVECGFIQHVRGVVNFKPQRRIFAPPDVRLPRRNGPSRLSP